MDNKQKNNRAKLKAKLEAQRLSRTKLQDAFRLLEEYQKNLSNKSSPYQKYLVQFLGEKLNSKIDSIANEEWGGASNESGGFSSGGCAGSD